MNVIQRAYLKGFLKAAGLSSPSGSTSTAAIPSLNAAIKAAPITKSPANINSWTNGFNPKTFVNHGILPAENNSNYGILKQYKHTTPEQASINTVNHALRDFEMRGGGDEHAFIKFLGSRYAPVGANNDPNNLNRNWVPNVTKLWDSYNATNHIQ